MKKFLRLSVVGLAVALMLTACGKKEEKPETEVTKEVYEDIGSKLEEISKEIDELVANAEKLKAENKIDEKKYDSVMALKDMLAQIGTEGNKENNLLYNELKKAVNDLKYDLSALDNPEKTDIDTALSSLMDCITDAEPAITEAKDKGALPEDRYNEFVAYKEEISAYIDGSKEQGNDIMSRLEAIRADITTMATQSEAENETIDKLLAKPVTVVDSAKMEELASAYLDLQNEVMEKTASGELESSKLDELLQTGVKVAQVKEALRTGNITEETKATMEECNKELKAYAEGINSDLADSFN